MRHADRCKAAACGRKRVNAGCAVVRGAPHTDRGDASLLSDGTTFLYGKETCTVAKSVIRIDMTDSCAPEGEGHDRVAIDAAAFNRLVVPWRKPYTMGIDATRRCVDERSR
jgi:hypothetical protein